MNEKLNSTNKIVLLTLGESTVGKTSFIKKYVKNEFNEKIMSTVGMDFYTKYLTFSENEKVKLIIYDTCGQENYHSLSCNLLRNADGIFLIYDITQQKTFDKINEWLNDIKDLKGNDFPIVLIGNKCDLEGIRVINRDEGENLARENGMEFYETSCQNGTNIEDSVLTLVKIIINQQKKEIEKEGKEEKKEKEGKEEKEENKPKKRRFKLSIGKNKKKKKKNCC